MTTGPVSKGELGLRASPRRRRGRTSSTWRSTPYVPDRSAFEKAVQDLWQDDHPDVRLNFLPYDPYTGPPPATLDVFASDCTYTGDLTAGYYVDSISANEVKNRVDLQRLTLEAAPHGASDALAGIPFLGCCTTLFYRRDDPDAKTLGNRVLSLGQLHGLLGDADSRRFVPPYRSNLVVELRGATTDACMYVQAWEQQQGKCVTEPAPDTVGRA